MSNARSLVLDAASTAGRGAKWSATIAGPKSMLNGDRQIVAARARRAQLNNGHASSAIETYVTNLIGTGVVPRPEVNDTLKKQIIAVWNSFVEESDADGRLDFYGQQALAVMSVVTSGETLIRFRNRRLDGDTLLPFQLQQIEGDHLDNCTYQFYGSNNNRVSDGIEFNRFGKRVAYHTSINHPSDSDFYSSAERVRIPAKNLLHIYRQLRPGQQRGLSWIANILISLYEIDAFEDAETVRRKFNSLITAFISDDFSEYNPAPETEASNSEDDDDSILDDITPGAAIDVPKGKKIELSEPAKSDPSSSEWRKSMLRKIAAGAGITYEQLTKDLSDVNFSSIRAGLIEARRQFEMQLQHIFVHQFFRPVYARVIESAVALGLIDITPAEFLANKRQYLACSWQAPAWEWVDPVKDVMAKVLKVRNGFASREDACRDYNNDIATVDRENAESLASAEGNKLVYDSIPAQTQKNGAVQSAEEAGQATPKE